MLVIFSLATPTWIFIWERLWGNAYGKIGGVSVAYPRINTHVEKTNHSLVHCEHPPHACQEHFVAQSRSAKAQLDRQSASGGMVGGKVLSCCAVPKKRNKLINGSDCSSC